MYVRKEHVSKNNFPVNYNGTLKASVGTEEITSDEHCRKFTVKKNKFRNELKHDKDKVKLSDDELILLGLLVFLYVNCEHSKDNLIMMGIIAYLLFY